MPNQENKQLVSRAYQEIFNHGNYETISEFYSEDNVHRFTTGVPLRVIQVAEKYRKAFPDIHIDIHELIAEDDKVVATWTATGTHEGEMEGIEPTGRRIQMQGSSVNRVEFGRIVETVIYQDDYALYLQLIN
jgi:steroid delta-isomerase-like uncharacterized protein